MSPRPMAEYQAAPGLSFHQLKDFAQSPDFYYRKHVMKTVPDRDCAAFAIGRALHCLVLEGPETFALRYVLAPPDHMTASGSLSTSKATREWLSSLRSDQEAISPGDAWMVKVLADRVRRNPWAAELLLTGEPESEVFTTFAGITVKGRADWWCDRRRLVVDLKTCKNLEDFDDDADRYCYDQQLAWYGRLFSARDLALIAVETCEPHRVQCFRFDSGALMAATYRNARLLDHFAECQDAGSWPADPEGIAVLSQR